MTLSVQCLTTFDQAPAARIWNSLLLSSSADPVFQSYEYQRSWWEAFSQNSCSKLFILLLKENENLIGIAPFYSFVVEPADLKEEEERLQVAAGLVDKATGNKIALQSFSQPSANSASIDFLAEQKVAARLYQGEKVLRLLSGLNVTDYINIIVPLERQREAWQAILNYWAVNQELWDVIDFRSLPDLSQALEIRRVALKGYDWQVWSGIEETCPRITLPASWDDYLLQLDKKDRYEVRRRLQKLELENVSLNWEITTSPQDLKEAFGNFITLHKASSQAKLEFMTPKMEKFFKSITRELGNKGHVEIATLYLNHTPAATLFSFLHNDRLLFYNSGYNPQYSTYRVGQVLIAYRIKKAIEQGLKFFDFLRGNEHYKYSLGAQDYFIYRCVIRKSLANFIVVS